MFVVFEGIDGSGKTTQVDLLAKYLRECEDKMVLVTREPGGDPLSESIREIIEQYHHITVPLVEAMLMVAARHQHVCKQIEPALNYGTTVICDRFIDSTYAYQGLNVSKSVIDILQSMTTSWLVPDLVIYLKVSPETAVRRMISKGESIHECDVSHVRSKLNAVSRNYDKLFSGGRKVEVVNAENDVSDVESVVRSAYLEAVDNGVGT